MADPRRLGGREVADRVERDALDRLETSREAGVDPCLATLLVSDDPDAQRFMDYKHEACADAGIETKRVDLPADTPAGEVYERVTDLAADPAVTALFVQAPLPAHVDETAVRRRIPPAKDVDCFAPANLGRLVQGEPRVRPVTELAVDRLLTAHDVSVAGRDAVVVGRTTAIGAPLAHLLCRRDATVTVCHSRTQDLAAKTRAADLLVTAAGEPELVDGSMVSEGVVVVDVSVNRVAGDESRVVGDVDAESVSEKAAAMTPVPGGVGPLTKAFLLWNVVTVSESAGRGGGDGPDQSR